MSLLFGFLAAGLNILILEDWYSLHWVDLIDLPDEPTKHERRRPRAQAAHRLTTAPRRE